MNGLLVNRFFTESARYCTECDTIRLMAIHFSRIWIYPAASDRGHATIIFMLRVKLIRVSKWAPLSRWELNFSLQLCILSCWSAYLHNCATWSVSHEWRLFCWLVFPPTIGQRCCLLWWHTSGCGRRWPCMILSSRVESCMITCPLSTGFLSLLRKKHGRPWSVEALSITRLIEVI